MLPHVQATALTVVSKKKETARGGKAHQGSERATLDSAIEQATIVETQHAVSTMCGYGHFQRDGSECTSGAACTTLCTFTSTIHSTYAAHNHLERHVPDYAVCDQPTNNIWSPRSCVHDARVAASALAVLSAVYPICRFLKPTW